MKDTFILKATNKAEFLAIGAYLKAKQFTIVNHRGIKFCPIYFVYEYDNFKPFIIDCKPAYLMPDYREYYTFPQLALFEREIQQLIKNKKQVLFNDLKLGEYFCFPNSNNLHRKTDIGVISIHSGQLVVCFSFDDNPVVKRVENVSIEHSFDVKG